MIRVNRTDGLLTVKTLKTMPLYEPFRSYTQHNLLVSFRGSSGVTSSDDVTYTLVWCDSANASAEILSMV